MTCRHWSRRRGAWAWTWPRRAGRRGGGRSRRCWRRGARAAGASRWRPRPRHSGRGRSGRVELRLSFVSALLFLVGLANVDDVGLLSTEGENCLDRGSREQQGGGGERGRERAEVGRVFFSFVFPPVGSFARERRGTQLTSSAALLLSPFRLPRVRLPLARAPRRTLSSLPPAPPPASALPAFCPFHPSDPPKKQKPWSEPSFSSAASGRACAR